MAQHLEGEGGGTGTVQSGDKFCNFTTTTTVTVNNDNHNNTEQKKKKNLQCRV